MKFTLRPYQKECVDKIITHLKKSLESQVAIMGTGAGKSLVIAEVARQFTEMSKKNVLCLAPSALLVEQNFSKYRGYDLPASIFCASLNKKSLRHPVVFGTPLSIKNAIERVKAENFGLIIIDECHGITDSIKFIIEKLKEVNPALRVLGLSASPFRTNQGFVYSMHYKMGVIDECVDPYFKIATYEIGAKELVDMNFLTPPVIGKTALRYETEKLVLDQKGQYTAESIHEVYEGKGRLTSEIIADICTTTAPYPFGVLIFCATIQHCMEAMESLPPDISGFTVGDTSIQPKKERERVENDFRTGKIRYLVNVSTQCVGVDFPICFCVALLRSSESPGLVVQMAGRALRLYENKKIALILDYSDNMQRLFPTGSIFEPKITAKKKSESEKIPAICPECSHENQFALRPDMDNYVSDINGYACWPDTKDLVTSAEGEPIPMHLGRRCTGIVRRVDRCGYYWTSKKCPECEHLNDIAARFCGACKAELVDPNAKLSLEGSKQGSIMVEPVMTITLEDKVAKNGTTKLKHVLITTSLRKRINLFLRMSIEAEREQFRLCRAMEDQECSVEFKPDGKYWKFVNLTTDNGYMK